MTTRGEQTREKIRGAARRLFAQNGYAGVTMKDVCDATGLSRGGLYRHYAGTAEIFQDIFSAENHSQLDFITQAVEGGRSAVDTLDSLLDVLCREMTDTESSLSLAICEYGQRCDSSFFQAMHERSVEKWTRLIEYGIRRGEFAAVDVAQTVDLLLYSYQGVRVFSRLMPDIASAAEHITAQLRCLLVLEKPV